MQLLCRIETEGYEAWRRAFDADAEGRAQAGLTLLQLWREADQGDHVVALFEVNDRARASSYLETQGALGDGLGQPVFLRTA